MVVVNTTDMWSAAATVFIVVALAALTVMGAWEHGKRSAEHEEIAQVIRIEMGQLVCSSKLNIFIQMQPKDHALTLEEIPTEYWLCMPRTLIRQQQK